MNLKPALAGLAALPLLASVGMAGQPVPLSDTNMDQITAGFQVPLPFVFPVNLASLASLQSSQIFSFKVTGNCAAPSLSALVFGGCSQ